MVNINLLPWREYEQSYKIKVLKKMLVSSLLFVILIIMVSHVLISQQEIAIRIRIAALNGKLNQYRIKHLRSVKPVETVSDNKNLQRIRQSLHPGKLFSEFEKMNQTRVCFTEIERINNTFYFTGKARSMPDLTEFLRHWNTAYLFTEIQIKLIESEENGLVRFGFQAKEI